METTELKPLQQAFREAMARVCVPVAVVTAVSAVGRPHGTTVSAFSSLSLDPPMVLVCLDRRSDLLALLHPGRPFGVNVLLRSQSEVARRFARKGHAKFAGTPWTCPAGVPRLTGAGAFLACRTERLVDGGDHVIVLGTVTTANAVAAAPLTYHDRGFGTHLPLGGQPQIGQSGR
ncbi:MAG: hypothetical protein V7603_789 [Micromonosporaceae bacterium]